MRNMNWLVAASAMVLAAGCVETAGYPTSYGGYSGYGYNSYGYNSGYYAQPTGYYYQPAPVYRPTTVVTQTRYVPVPVPVSTYPHRHHHHHGDWDRNGDGIPDRYQR